MSPSFFHHRPSLHTHRGYMLVAIIFLVLLLAAVAVFAAYMYQLDTIVRKKFDGKRWEIPAKVYARPLELYATASLDPAALRDELTMLNYHQTDNYNNPGTFEVNGDTWFIHTRGFNFGESQEAEQVIKLQIQNATIATIQSTQTSGNGLARLEPVQIGGIYPRHNEDRVLVQLKDVPQPLIDALIVTEDRSFYSHHGISVRGIGRAVVSNTTGGPRQGGSTLTQQLVKNFYLTPEKTLKRKANEALMAILLEMHYSKENILETYLNEINLGQNGNHSINGFGLASQFYFALPLNELTLNQIALLVGLVKGPSQYNPWRHPDLALERRNIILKLMLDNQKINQDEYDENIKKPLGIVRKPVVGQSLFPDFLDVVRRQLSQQYQEDDLAGEGLRIFSTLEPRVQKAAQMSFDQSLNQLIKSNPTKLNGLQGALMIANPQNGELMGVVGGSGLFTGYNRALDAHRQIGSLVKPAIYLTALQSGRYNLLSPLNDGPVNISGLGMKNWQPQNYDHRDHGIVPLYMALAHSYNQATVNLGWELGVPNVLTTIKQLGVSANLPQYPSVLLGAVDLSPLDVLTMYQTYAAGGFGYPITAIRSVVDSDNNTLTRIGLGVKQRVDPAANYLLNFALQQVVQQGTATSILNQLPATLNLAGKTGTTNDARDAWFAGYSGNYVAVTWVGHDDNRPTGLSGATGALPIWINLMKRLPLTPVAPPIPATVQWQWLDTASGKISAQGCGGAMYVPILSINANGPMTSCAEARRTELENAQLAANNSSMEANGTALNRLPPSMATGDQSTFQEPPPAPAPSAPVHDPFDDAPPPENRHTNEANPGF